MPLPTNLPTGTNYIFPLPQQRQFQPPYFQRSPVLLRSAPVIPMPLSTGTSYELWPQPLRVPWRPQDPTTQLQDIPFPLMVSQVAYIIQTAENPVFTRPAAYRGFWRAQDPSNYEGTWQPLLGPQAAPPFLTPFSQDVWPGPITVQWRSQDWSTSLIGTPLTLLTANGMVPFNQDIWPNPTVAQSRSQSPQGSPLALLNPAAAAFAQPFAQTDWPNPKNPYLVLQSWAGLNLSIGTFPSSTPFALYDWPVPQRPQWRQAFTQPNITITLTPPVQAPFATPFVQSSWPVPLQTVKVIPPTPQFSPANIPFTQPTFATPFSLTDWPTPQQVRQSWAFNEQGIITIPAVATPFSQFDWPVPKGAIYPTSLRTWISSTIELLNPTPQVFATLPFNQYSWPVPQRATPAIQFYPPYNNKFIVIPPFLTLPVGAQSFTPPVRQLPTYKQQNLNSPTALTIPSPPPPVGHNFEWLARARRRGRR